LQEKCTAARDETQRCYMWYKNKWSNGTVCVLYTCMFCKWQCVKEQRISVFFIYMQPTIYWLSEWKQVINCEKETMRRKLAQRKARNEKDKYVKKVSYKAQYLFHDTHQTRLITNFTFFTMCIVIYLLQFKPKKNHTL